MTLVLKGTSRQSFTATRTNLDKQLASLDSAAIVALSADLFTMVRTLDTSLALRRGLTDPSRSGSDKSTLATNLFGKSLSGNALTVLNQMLQVRWSSPRDLGDVIELLAIESEAAASEKDGSLDKLESEIFAFSETVAGAPELRAALSNKTINAGQASKSSVVSALLSGKVTANAIRLISQLIDHPRGRNIESCFRDIASAVSSRRNRSIVHVASATVLNGEQIARLTKALEKEIGRKVQVNVAVDHSVIGGLSIRFGDELIDGTVASRLGNASRSLVGKSA